MDTFKISVLYLGYLDCQYFRIAECSDKDKMYRSPVSAILIHDPALGNVLYDTGNNPFHQTAYNSHINKVYPVGHFISIEDALKSKGLRCSDIDLLIMSHLHFDHAGGLQYFAGSKAIKNVIVSEPELLNACKNVFTDNAHSAYVKSLFDIKGIIYHLVSGTMELSPHITLFVQNSHTPGVIGLIIKTKSMGNIILTSDTVYTKDSWEHKLPPGGDINKTAEEFYQNLDFLQSLQKQYNATMFFGHDYNQITEWSQKDFIQ